MVKKEKNFKLNQIFRMKLSTLWKADFIAQKPGSLM